MADEATQETAAEAAENVNVSESTADVQQDPETPGAEALGDPGKKALDAMKAKWKEAEQRAREREAALAELQAKIEGKEAEFAAEQERRKVEAEALAKANERILKAEVRAQAAGKLADPSDALRYLDLEQFEVGADGEVDRAAVTDAIEGLVKAKPYLAAQGGTSVFQSPGADREGSGHKRQLTRDELKQMTPEQIVTARAEGRLDDLLGAKN